MAQRIISASLSPNTQHDDVMSAITMVLQPWKWKHGPYANKIVVWFEKNFPRYSAYSFNSGRSAMFCLLKAFGIKTQDEVLVQAFTCVAVPNAVNWTGATSIFVDVDASLNIDVHDAEKKLSPRTRAIIVQHTLGLPANMTALTAFAKKHSLILIEDCAHALGARYKGNKLGTYGDAAFFSFGRDKVLSSVFGGVAIIKNIHKAQIKQLDHIEKELKDPPAFWILQQLLHPIIFSVVLPLYTSGIGKGILWIFQRLKLLSFPVYGEEKVGIQPQVFPTRYPNALAYLLLTQLKKLEQYNERRKENAKVYINALAKRKQTTLLGYPADSIFLRFPLLIEKRDAFIAMAKQHNILIGNWYHNTIDPSGVDFEVVGYVKGSCPKSERYAENIINLPTNITAQERDSVISLFSQS